MVQCHQVVMLHSMCVYYINFCDYKKKGCTCKILSRHLLNQLPILDTPHMFTNVDTTTVGSSSPSALGHTIPEVSKLLRAWI